MMTTAGPSHYVHGSDEVEQRRLSLLNTFINESSLRELKLCPGQRVLDVGSGLAQFTRAMARNVMPGGFVLGVERDERQIAEALRQAAVDGEAGLVEVRMGSAFDPPLADREWGSFDLVHTRFLLEHVPEPAVVVRAMVRAAKPGGRIVLADDDHDVMRLWPPPPGFDRLWTAYQATYARHGNDPEIGRKLVSLLHDAGATPVRNTWVFFGSCAGHETWSVAISNLLGVLRGARQEMLDIGAASASEVDQSLASLQAWAQSPSASIWYAICWAEGARPRA